MKTRFDGRLTFYVGFPILKVLKDNKLTLIHNLESNVKVYYTMMMSSPWQKIENKKIK